MSTSLQQFFEINLILVYFVYGLVFFVLGLAIALQSRRHSQLELARELGWLAAFGLVHGFHEWGAVFIPIQAAYQPETTIHILEGLQALMLAGSYVLLFQFGVEMLRGLWPWLVVLPLIVTVSWLLLCLVPWIVPAQDPHTWIRSTMIWARYLIGFPASICSALGLRYQADRYIKPMGMRKIYRMLQVAGVSLLVYAFFGGLVVPEGNFFPANWLNETALMRLTGIPVPIYRSFIGLILTIAIIRAMDVFEVEVDLLIEQTTLERNLALERERIGRELHDTTIQTIYTAGLLVEAARQKLPEEDKANKLLERSMEVLNEAIAGLRAYVTGLRPSLADQTLGEALRSVASDARWKSLIDIQIDEHLPPGKTFSAPRTRHVAAILNEAISNAARHGRAHRVSISAGGVDDSLVLTIEDDGEGFQESKNDVGYGLRNMRDRARLLSGVLTVESRPDSGVLVRLVAPWEVEE